MDSGDIDLQKFADVPFVIERPVEASLLADQATALLAKRGLRMSFGVEKEISASVTGELAAAVPNDMGVLDRQTGTVVAAVAHPSAVVAGPSRPRVFTNAPFVKEAMLLEGYRMTGHALLGSDREETATFAVMTAIQKGFDNKSLQYFAAAQVKWEADNAAAGYVSQTLSGLLAQKERIVESPTFATNGPSEMAIVAKRFSAEVGAAANAIRLASLGGTSEAQTLLPQLATLPPVSGLTDETPKFEVKEFGSEALGPSYLPQALFSQTSMKVVQGVHPDLLKVVARARELSNVRFEVVPKTGGIRDHAMQADLKAKGKSRAKLGRHTIGYAIDLVPVTKKGKIDFSNRKGFDSIRAAMEKAANELGVPIQWGGNWKKMVDKPHFELDRKVYPGPGEEPDPAAVLTAFR